MCSDSRGIFCSDTTSPWQRKTCINDLRSLTSHLSHLLAFARSTAVFVFTRLALHHLIPVRVDKSLSAVPPSSTTVLDIVLGSYTSLTRRHFPQSSSPDKSVITGLTNYLWSRAPNAFDDDPMDDKFCDFSNSYHGS